MNKMYSRRQFVRSSALTGTSLALAGCCTFRPCVLPSPCRNENRPVTGIMDTHTHVFNGSDLQVAGFLSGPLANEYPEFASLIRALAPWAEDISHQFAPDADKEHERLDEVQDPFPGEASLLLGAVDDDKEKAHEIFGRELANELRDNDELKNILEQTLSNKDVAPGDLGPEARDLLDGTNKSNLNAYKGALQIDAAIGFNLFAYVSRFLYYRYVNVIELIAAYGCDDKNNVETFIAALVDFDYPLAGGKRTPTSLRDQIALMSRISELAQDRLKLLVPFCPFKQADPDNQSSLQLVREALTKPGFVGVKIYPPMGFYPYGNEEFGVDDGRNLDSAMNSLFEVCVDRNVPVMAHSSPSLCASREAKCETPGPKGWEKALKHVLITQKKTLRVSLGHFGVFPKDTDNWTADFMGLMNTEWGADLYADLSYVDEILEPGKVQWVAEKLASLIRLYPEIVPERLMYGTDWLMLSLEPEWESYYVTMKKVLSKAEELAGATGFEKKVLSANAERWLGG